MHQNSKLLFGQHAEKYIFEGAKVLEIGPDNFPSTYQSLCTKKTATWDSLDIYQSPKLTYSTTNPYSFPIPENTYDIVISGQVIEHVQKVWVWMKEIARVMAPGGLVITIAPASWPYHEHPVDCWRIYPEGMKALSEDAGLTVVECLWGTLEKPEFKHAIPGRSANEQDPNYRSITEQLAVSHNFPVEKSFDTICVARKPIPG
jgi:SAM-dependent methyltransferase